MLASGTTARGSRRVSQSLWSALACLSLGVISGVVVTLIMPARVLPSPPFPGLSLIVVPPLVGTGAGLLGARWERAGDPRVALATFWGGALFALGMTTSRLALLSLAH